MINDSRGTADAVGYVLAFALITATIGSAFGVGLVGLDDRQDAERVNNAERAMDVLANNIESIRRNGDPSRATEVSLAGGTLRIGEPVTVTVGQYDTGANAFTAENRTVVFRPIVYEANDKRIVYEAGALYRVGAGNVTLREPSFAATSDRTTVAVVRTRPRGDRTTISGDITVRVRAQRVFRSSPRSFEPGSNELRINVSSPRAGLWADYFRDEPGFVVEDESDGRVSARINSDQVYVQRIAIGVELEL